MTDLENNILMLVTDTLTAEQLELVNFSFRAMGSTYGLEVLADKPAGGINMDECAALNKKLIQRIDESTLLYDNYTLTVSSPGLDWPLKTSKDFLRVRNRPVRIHLQEKVYDKLEHHGVVQGADETAVTISCKDQPLVIPLDKIIKAVQII